MHAGGHGHADAVVPRAGRKLFVCTIEKALGLLHRVLGRGQQDRIGCLVCDELHMIATPGRGAVLESLLATAVCRRCHHRRRCMGSFCVSCFSLDRATPVSMLSLPALLRLTMAPFHAGRPRLLPPHRDLGHVHKSTNCRHDGHCRQHAGNCKVSGRRHDRVRVSPDQAGTARQGRSVPLPSCLSPVQRDPRKKAGHPKSATQPRAVCPAM